MEPQGSHEPWVPSWIPKDLSISRTILRAFRKTPFQDFFPLLPWEPLGRAL